MHIWFLITGYHARFSTKHTNYQLTKKIYVSIRLVRGAMGQNGDMRSGAFSTWAVSADQLLTKSICCIYR